MKPESGPGIVDVLVVVFSPLIVAGLTVIFLLGWWVGEPWRRVRMGSGFRVLGSGEKEEGDLG